MEVIFYIAIFIIGTFFGSFYMETIQRMCKKQKIFSMHRYCANCGQKLKFYETIPILGYILSKEKCRNCKKKTNNLYILLELISGILFLATAYSLRFTLGNFSISKLILFIFIILYYSYIILTIGLDIKNESESISLLAFGIIISIAYMVYLCINVPQMVYSSIVYLILIIILLLLDVVITKKRAQNNYTLNLLITLWVMLVFTQELTCIFTVIGTLISIALSIIIYKLQNKRKRIKTNNTINIRVGFIMGILNIFIFLTLINIANI